MKDKISEGDLVLLDIKNYKAQKDHWNTIDYPNRSKYDGTLMYEIDGKIKINVGIIEVHLKENKAIALIQEVRDLNIIDKKLKYKNKTFKPRRD